MPACSCKAGCKNRVEMRESHGHPDDFAERVWASSDMLMITPDEARAAEAKYRSEWAAAPEQ